MTCHDVERLWNEILDARGSAEPALQNQIADHAATCPGCHAVSARYQRLQNALTMLGPAPSPSPELARRFRQATQPTMIRRPPVWKGRMVWIGPALAATILVAVSLRPRGVAPPISVRPSQPPIYLASTLAEATTATLELARGVSAPAARLGLDVLDLEGDSLEGGTTEPDDGGPETVSLIQSVSTRLDARSRPLSGSALQAFEFLIPASPEADPRPPIHLEEKL